MTTFVIQAVCGPDGWVVRAPLVPAWRPKPTPDLDRADFEAKLKSYQTRTAEFEWLVSPAGGLDSLPYLGFDRGDA